MSTLEAIILGLIQGLTEFLPVSSSGHIELTKAILGVEVKDDLMFTLTVHGATVLSTIVVFYKDIARLVREGIKFRHNESVSYIGKILISMIPIGLAGVLFKDRIEELFNGNLVFVGAMLLVTGALLLFTYYAGKGEGSISYKSALLVGLAQTIAILPGISRSGSTIATGLLLGISKEEVTKFSFLMVLLPIIGANVMAIASIEITATTISPWILGIGFITAFISGFLACKWMISIVRKGKLTYFAIYCFVAGTIAMLMSS
ncbi:undecaprenyl-diphosphate phosphatase [Fulvivirgaceae bacterium BMA12]|uniref:Undecaprenyl-diphosphatase n=1 Tax=Agaribacillus aureus TaxID=3051825 RepID=A0ABT8L4E1_9BACT|nr:undecaprenyl-diphosphate phosphatase [Fulvivirgaceae bacterium BMA12]